METTKETQTENRRQSPRRKPRVTVKIECRKGAYGLGRNLASKVLDISDTGVRLIVSQAIELKGELEVVFDGYGLKEPVKRVGNVRWQEKLESGDFCIGVEFQKNLDYRDWQTISAPN